MLYVISDKVTDDLLVDTAGSIIYLPTRFDAMRNAPVGFKVESVEERQRRLDLKWEDRK